MNHEILRTATVEEAVQTASRFVLDQAESAIHRSNGFTLAVSGGRTPAAMFSAIVSSGEDLNQWDIWQVDERIAADGDPARNLIQVCDTLAPRGAKVHPMPVNDEDRALAMTQYANTLPLNFDLIHLGLGADGHTASLLPGDAALRATGLVATTTPYQGNERMTLTYAALARAQCLVWLITGADKRAALASLLNNDMSIPASHVSASRSVIIADSAALGA